MAINPDISLQAQAPTGFSSLKDLLNLQASGLALRRAQDTYSADVAERRAQSESAQTAARVAAATADPLIAQQQALTQTSQTASNQAQFNLTNQMHQRTIDQITGLIGDESVRNGDSQGIQSALDRAAKNALQYGSNPDEVNSTIQPLKQLAAQNPKAVQPQLINFLRQGLLGPQQAGVIQPSGPQINTGQVQYQANTNPLSAAPQGPVAGTGAVNQIPTGSQAYDPNTGKPYLTGPNGQGVQNAPALGEPEQVKANQAEVLATRSAGDQVPVQRNINQAILRLSKDATTAPGSHVWQQAIAAATGGRVGSDYQELTKYLERNAIQAMGAMGGAPSDARLNAAVQATGSNQYNPAALQEITKFNDAATSALDKYRQGMDRAIGYQNQNINALPQFKAEWARNLDPDIFRVENAIRDNDQQELQNIKQRFVNQYGKQGAAAHMKELAKKRDNLESLANSGKIQ